ncbi:autotransporter domain-containing protein [Novosphingobium sp. FKTRR1]|uniref:autotransporter outer membrane beta-barrel domain-containing protein n=1 Tax=Novosphingobium sp. FKTRR1 TaxID=2879118 RepID=UPI001CEFFB1E|nr:autotransporter domain-containing protein [Novosphingobium sp. FKTRR1]
MPDDQTPMQRKSNRFLSTVGRRALVGAALLLPAAQAFADTSVGSATTTPLLTSSAGNVTIASGGTIKVASGNAITIDAAKTATVNSGGVLDVGSADGASGIVANSGLSSTITNQGTIKVTEDFTAKVLDSSTIAAGPIASASNRYGIHVLSGGTYTGAIQNGDTGVITVEGLNSAGIAVDGTLAGTLTNTGTITVKGDNSVGIRTAAVTGDVLAGGTISTVGQGSQAVVVGGDVGGIVKLNGGISQSYTYTADDSTTQTLSRTALQTGKALVEVDGNVAGGVVVYAPLTTSSTDTSRGVLQAYGNGPALQIGGTRDITIGGGTTVAGTYSLGIDGSVSSNAYYSSTDAYGVVIGGKGGNVTLSKGIAVSGTVSTTTVDSGSAAVTINAGSNVATLYNSGTIQATASQSAFGNLYGVKDASGTLTTLNNTGYITVSGTTTGRSAAIDLSSNTSGTTIKQYLNSTNATSQTSDKAASGYDPDTATVYTAITGNIYTGSGNDTVDIESGKVTGNAFLGTGNNTVILADDAKWIGNINFGTAGTATMTMAGNSRFTGNLELNSQVGTLTLSDSSRWLGTVTGGSQLTVNVNSGTFGANATGTSTIKALNVGASGTLRVYIDGAKGTSSTLVADTATFASGSKVAATISSLQQGNATYTVLSAGTLTGGSNLTSTALAMPVLYNGSVTLSGNNLLLTVSRKSATELGLTTAESAAYDAIVGNALSYTYLEKSLLQVADSAALKTQFNEFLPDYAGGTFDFVTRGSRLAARHIDDDSSIFTISDVGGWFEPIYFNNKQHASSTTNRYTVSGFGVTAGLEKTTSLGNVGGTFAYVTGNVKNSAYNEVKAHDLEIGAFWRKAAGPLYAYARVGYGKGTFTSARTFNGVADSAAFTYSAAGKWKGTFLDATAGLSYAVPLGESLKLKPKAVFEYYRLKEKGYTESGDTAIALVVDPRTSKALNATTTLAASWSSGESSYEGRAFTVELEGGRRNHLSGALGNTTAAFGSGSSFTLTPGKTESAWVGNLSVLQGGLDYTWKLSAGAERPQSGGLAYSMRASLSFAM